MLNRMDRRKILIGGAALATGAAAFGSTAEAPANVRIPFRHSDGPRCRVLVLNDLAGDIDGLFATVHALLSSSAEVRGVIGTSPSSKSALVAREIVGLMDLADKVPVFEGASHPMTDVRTPVNSAGTQAIITEAMRTDTHLPLFVCVGGGLTEVASALLLEPRISDRFTLVWIGGEHYPQGGPENNVMIDAISTQYIFNESDVKMWQVTASAYALCQVSDTELQAFVAPYGKIGPWLYSKLFEIAQSIKHFLRNPRDPWNTGETWTLGDSPLVLLTALTAWQPSNMAGDLSAGFKYESTNASQFDEIPAPRIDARGMYTPRPDGRKIRVYKTLDTRLLFGDFFAKMQVNYPRSGSL